MPYIKSEARSRLDAGAAPDNVGELNDVLSKQVDEYLKRKGGVSYTELNAVISVLACAKLELYRRIAAPYENQKVIENYAKKAMLRVFNIIGREHPLLAQYRAHLKRYTH